MSATDAVALGGDRAAVARPTRVRWKMMVVLFAIGFVAYLLRTNMSVAGVSMRQDLQLSDLQLGAVLAAFAWGYSLFQFPGGVIGGRFGGRLTLAVITALWGVLNILVAAVPSRAAPVTVTLLSLIALRFLMGVAQAPLFPVMGGDTIRRWFPIGGWALPNGLSNAGLTLGAAATGPIIAWLTQSVGWRASFVATAPLALVVALWWWWYARDVPSEHQAINAEEVRLIDAHRDATTVEPPAPGSWRIALANRQVQLITLSYFCANYLFYFFFNWLYTYLVEVRKFELLEGGFYSSAPWIVGAVGATLGGLVCDGLTRHRGITFGCRAASLAGLVLAAVFILAAATAPSPYVAVVFLSLCLACQQFTDSSAWAATMSVSGRLAPAACGVLNTGGNLSGGVVALAVPIISSKLGWPAALASAAAMATIGGLIWFLIRADEPLRADG